MNAWNGRTWGVALAATAALLAGCKDARKDRLEGAQRALGALPDVEVVATDADAGVLKVRSRSSGEVTVIDLGSSSGGARTSTAPATATAPPSPGSMASPTTAPAVESDTASASSSASPVGSAGSTADDGTSTSSAAAAGTPAAPLAPGSVATPETVAAASANAPVVVRDPQGRVQVIEGSGFRIERSPAPRGAQGASRAAPPSAGGAGAAGELRRVGAPVVCAAGETRSLQGVLIDVPGAGIVAERGCNLSVANVRVRSGGWGLVVNPGASVRIDDSVIEGRSGALDLYPGATLSAWATTFRGALGRPATAPQFVDRGGNTWQ